MRRERHGEGDGDRGRDAAAGGRRRGCDGDGRERPQRPVVGVQQVDEEDELLVITSDGNIVRMRVSEISLFGRNTQGVRIIKLSGEEKVVSAIKIDDNLI